jgi:hypothetical protein
MFLLRIVLGASLLASTASAEQELDLSFLKGLESKAREATSVDLGPEQLKLMLGFAGDFNPDLKAVAQGLERVQVKVLQFDQEGAYNLADMENLRSKVKSSDYLPFITTKDKGGFTEILLRKGAKGMRGFIILAAQQRELTIVNIVGDLDLASLSKLTGKFGIPNIKLDPKDKPSTQPKED